MCVCKCVLFFVLPSGLAVDVLVVKVLGLDDAVGGELVEVAPAHV